MRVQILNPKKRFEQSDFKVRMNHHGNTMCGVSRLIVEPIAYFVGTKPALVKWFHTPLEDSSHPL